MKKIASSIAFILAFAGYALYQNISGTQSSGIAMAAQAQNTPSAQHIALSPISQNTGSAYRDGTYTGTAADAYYGNVQVQVTVANGKVADLTFLDYPHDQGTSRSINAYATPLLRSEAIQAQSTQVSGVSGATDTSAAFKQSLASALSQARA